MTNREYFDALMNKLFDANNKTVEELVQNKQYCEFEDDVEEIIRTDFKLLGCDTSNGKPTGLGMSLWLDAKVRDASRKFMEQKYKVTI